MFRLQNSNLSLQKKDVSFKIAIYLLFDYNNSDSISKVGRIFFVC